MTDLFHLLACATCRPDAGSTAATAANGAIFVMLGAMGVIFSGFSAVAFSFIRKQRALSRRIEAMPPPPADGPPAGTP